MNKNKTLYRDHRLGKVAGVCAGIAEYFGIEIWLVRILTITAALLMTPGFIIVGYIVFWAVLDKKPSAADFNQASQQTESSPSFKGYVNKVVEEEPVEVKDSVWRAGQSPKEAFRQVQQRYIRTENRLRKLESYVTSNEFQLNRELNKL